VTFRRIRSVWMLSRPAIEETPIDRESGGGRGQLSGG
jgi:hypothetical protein